MDASHQRKCLTLMVASFLLPAPFLAALATYVVKNRESKAEDRETWTFAVHVIDQNGDAVGGAQVATMWSANGPTYYKNGLVREVGGKLLRMESMSEGARFWTDEGKLMPYPYLAAEHLGKADFRFEGIRGAGCVVFATNREQTLGACLDVEKQSRTQTLILSLKPLVRVTGKLTCPQVNRVPDWTMVTVHLPDDPRNPKGFVRCGSMTGDFSFLLPPGKYDLYAYSESPNAELSKPFVRISVPEREDEIDLGTLELTFPESRGDYSFYYGQTPPPLDITGAIGVSSDIDLDSLLGKWVLLEFWSPSCGQCVAVSLPKLRELHTKYASHRDRFVVLTICSSDQQFRSFQAFKSHYEELVENTWGGAELPFSVLFDGEQKTKNAYGVTGWPTQLLIDPEGRLVKWGDAGMLEAKLESIAQE